MTSHVIVLDKLIDASRDDVWDVLTDVARADEVLTSVHHVDLLTEGPYDVGTEWREARRLLGHHGEETLRVAECHAPRHTMVEIQVGRDRVTMSYALTPHSGQTRVSLTMALDTSHRTSFGKFAWNTWGNIGYESTRRMLQADLDDIAAAAEGVRQG